MHSPLEFTLILLGFSVLGVVAFRMLQLPPMLGYLIVGIIVGPHTPGFVAENETVRMLSEFGVVFLMFSVGLEFSLAKLKAMRKIVFGLGLSQVSLSILFVMLVCALAAYFMPQWFSVSWQAGLAMGAAMSMSSTAIVSKLLAERMELETDHGRRIFGILLFQDLALVPLLILVPALANNPPNLALTLGLAFGKAIVAMVLLLFVGQKVLSWWLNIVVKRRSQELFMLNLLLITLGAAWITEMAGLSLELGAFIVGMLISETQYKHQVEVDIQSFRDVLLGLFFITIGMLLNVQVVLANWWIVLLLVIGPLVFKFGLIAALARFFGAPMGTSLRTGLALAQAGEFGFVLLNQAGGLHLVDDLFIQVILASMVLSMFIAPFLIAQSDRIVMKLCANEWMMQSLALTNIASQTIATEQHVIIAGFGRTGQSIARLLDDHGIPYHALDLDPERVREAGLAGATVSYGDVSRRESLIAAGIHRAAAMVIAFAETPAAIKVMHFAHELAPELPIIVRSLDGSDFEQLKQAGATEVVPEALESSMVLALFTIRALGVPTKRVLRIIQNTRKTRYASLRGYFQGSHVEPGEEVQQRLHSVTLPEGADVIGKTLGDLPLDGLDVAVTAVRRGKTKLELAPGVILQAGDVLVLCGPADSLALAEEAIFA
ncbi:MAG: potassium transporter [Burkholderiaceae bacterium]|nr:potassium transporter [Burkholderiaceae bacterium]